MIYEVRISIFGQILTTTVEANDREHLLQRIHTEIKVTGIAVISNISAEQIEVLKAINIVK